MSNQPKRFAVFVMKAYELDLTTPEVFEGAGGFAKANKRMDDLLKSGQGCVMYRQVLKRGGWQTMEKMR